MFEDTWVSDRLLEYHDWFAGNEKLQQEIETARGKTYGVADLSEDLQEFYRLQTEEKKDATPVYMQQWNKQFGGLNKIMGKVRIVLKSIPNGTLFKKTYRFLKKSIGENLEKEYGRLARGPEWQTPFVYVPLSFQPERTTSPQGDMFVDQILMIETLARTLPDGWSIYVKEHPTQWWFRTGTEYTSCRYPGYYRRIAAIPNVRLLPIRTNSYELIRHCRATAVSTGTAGWEALLRSKPAFVFGYPWYRDCPEAFRVKGVEDCRAAFVRLQSGFAVSQAGILNFLKCFDLASFHGYLEPFVEKNSKINSQQSLENITNAIIAYLRS